MTSRDSVFLERALLFTFVMHGLGILSMALFLLPGMPGGGTLDPNARIQYIATHAWGWRIGWLPWQLTALSDLLLAIALLRTRWIPKVAAWFTLFITVCAVIPDQMGQFAWITKGIRLAQTDPASYLAYEEKIFPWTAAWGATLYCIAAIGWTWCFVAAKVWNRSLTILSAFLWPLFFAVCIGPFFAMNAKLVAVGNGVGFFLLQAWFVLVLEAIQRRKMPDAVHGRFAIWKHPQIPALDWIANSRFVRSCGEMAPLMALQSDITNVVYVNYIVEAERLEPLVPDGLELQRLGKDQRYALMTFLTFQHHGFGPRFLRSARQFFPSAIQTNWRIHVSNPQTGRQGIYFITNAITSTIYSLGARIFSEGMPMHVLRSAEVSEERVFLDPGKGSGPDCEAVLQYSKQPEDGPWRVCFGSWKDFLAYAVPQDRAMSSQPWHGRITSQEIHLGIPLEICRPLQGEVQSRAARAIVGDAPPFCFFVPKVNFLFEREEYESQQPKLRVEANNGSEGNYKKQTGKAELK